MITKHQKKLRKNNLGSSDLPVILGMHPFERPTPFDIWGRLTGQVEDEIPQTAAMRMGSALESTVIALFSEDRPTHLKNLRRKHPTLHLACNVDAWTVEGHNPVEAKTCDHWSPTRDQWGPTDENVPEHVAIQATAHMMVAQREVCYVPALVSGAYREFLVRRNEDLIEAMLWKIEEWWENHVVKGNAPEGLPSREVGIRWIRKPGKVISLPEDYASLPGRIQQNKGEAKGYAEDAKHNERELLKVMGDAEEAHSDNLKVNVKWQERSSIDAKALARDHPEIAAKYTKKTRFPVMRISENKELPDADPGDEEHGTGGDRQCDGTDTTAGQPQDAGSPGQEDGAGSGCESVPAELDEPGGQQAGDPAVQPEFCEKLH